MVSVKSNKWSKFFSYYKKYLSAFLWDMFFSMLGAAIMLIIPLIVRHITYHVIYYEVSLARREILRLGLLCLVLIALACCFFAKGRCPFRFQQRISVSGAA